MGTAVGCRRLQVICPCLGRIVSDPVVLLVFDTVGPGSMVVFCANWRPRPRPRGLLVLAIHRGFAEVLAGNTPSQWAEGERQEQRQGLLGR